MIMQQIGLQTTWWASGMVQGFDTSPVWPRETDSDLWTSARKAAPETCGRAWHAFPLNLKHFFSSFYRIIYGQFALRLLGNSLLLHARTFLRTWENPSAQAVSQNTVEKFVMLGCAIIRARKVARGCSWHLLAIYMVCADSCQSIR